MTAATLGFAADYLATTGQPLQFDIDPLETDLTKHAQLNMAVTTMDAAILAYLKRTGKAPQHVRPGLSPGYTPGAMIMGVYLLAGQDLPRREGMEGALVPPTLSPKGVELWDSIRTMSPAAPQYRGRGGYTGFVDNKNTEGNTDPVGPRSTVRMVAPSTGVDGEPLVRWLPPNGHPLWASRKRRDNGTYVPWGLIGGHEATNAPGSRNPTGAGNVADQIEREMGELLGMAFVGQPTIANVATYTHGMIQAIYKAYSLGPSCVPFEVAVGDVTKKMASCMGCTLFMYAVGYPPTSIHLGSAESWAPLYEPYNPNGDTEPNEIGVLRDLNNAWHARCRDWLMTGLKVLDDGRITPNHRASRDAVRRYLTDRSSEATAAGNLILDALTMHDAEVNRISRTVQMTPEEAATERGDVPATGPSTTLPPPSPDYLDGAPNFGA